MIILHKGQIQNLRFATDGIFGDIFSCYEFPVVRLDTMNRFLGLCAFMPGRIGITTVGHVVIAAQFVSATDGIDCSIFSVRRILKIVLPWQCV